MQINYVKSGLLAMVILGLFACIVAGRIDFSDAAPYLTLIVGYAIGNGVQAYKGEPVAPLARRA